LWVAEKDRTDDPAVTSEIKVARLALDNFFNLEFSGGIIRVNGEIQAYTIGEHLNSESFNMHIEKALANYQGTYAAINCEFVNYLADTGRVYKYINREEDTGAEGLRKAKLSYHPAYLIEKFSVKIK
jgi:hypothetical protein